MASVGKSLSPNHRRSSPPRPNGSSSPSTAATKAPFSTFTGGRADHGTNKYDSFGTDRYREVVNNRFAATTQKMWYNFDTATKVASLNRMNLLHAHRIMNAKAKVDSSCPRSLEIMEEDGRLRGTSQRTEEENESLRRHRAKHRQEWQRRHCEWLAEYHNDMNQSRATVRPSSAFALPVAVTDYVRASEQELAIALKASAMDDGGAFYYGEIDSDRDGELDEDHELDLLAVQLAKNRGAVPSPAFVDQLTPTRQRQAAAGNHHDNNTTISSCSASPVKWSSASPNNNASTTTGNMKAGANGSSPQHVYAPIPNRRASPPPRVKATNSTSSRPTSPRPATATAGGRPQQTHSTVVGGGQGAEKVAASRPLSAQPYRSSSGAANQHHNQRSALMKDSAVAMSNTHMTRLARMATAASAGKALHKRHGHLPAEMRRELFRASVRHGSAPPPPSMRVAREEEAAMLKRLEEEQRRLNPSPSQLYREEVKRERRERKAAAMGMDVLTMLQTLHERAAALEGLHTPRSSPPPPTGSPHISSLGTFPSASSSSPPHLMTSPYQRFYQQHPSILAHSPEHTDDSRTRMSPSWRNKLLEHINYVRGGGGPAATLDNNNNSNNNGEGGGGTTSSGDPPSAPSSYVPTGGTTMPPTTRSTLCFNVGTSLVKPLSGPAADGGGATATQNNTTSNGNGGVADEAPPSPPFAASGRGANAVGGAANSISNGILPSTTPRDGGGRTLSLTSTEAAGATNATSNSSPLPRASPPPAPTATAKSAGAGARGSSRPGPLAEYGWTWA